MNGDAPQQPPEPDSSWQYSDDRNPPPQSDPTPPLSLDGEVTWTASEYIEHGKDPKWYLLLLAGTVVVDGIVYLWTKDVFTVIVITIMAILLAIMAARKPQVLTYTINNAGIAISDKFYPFALFRSFSIIDEGAFSSITLMPLKRFMVPISIYYSPEDEERIITKIAQHLPHEERKRDIMDHFTHSIKF